MGDIGAVPRQQVFLPTGSKKTFVKIVRWTLYVSSAIAIVLGVLVWPGNIRELGGIHGLAGWLAILSLWVTAGLAARRGASRSSVWLAVGWGVVTAVGASAQYQLPAGTWITALHVATGLGTVGFGVHLFTSMREAAGAGSTIQQAAAEFLAMKRIAVTGVSRNASAHGSNIVYRRLRERGYEVYPVNPNATHVEGAAAFPDLKSIPGGVEAVVIATRPEHAMATLRECADLGIDKVWMHRSVGGGSVSEEAAAWGRARGMRVIAGGCPLMFDPVADTGHKIMRPLLTLTGKVPRRV